MEEKIMISQELTIELKEILLKEFGKCITLAQANRLGNGLVNYVSLLTKMDKQNQKEVQT